MNRLAVTYFEKMLHEMNGPITTIYLLSDLMLSNSNVKLDKINNRENLRNIYAAAKKLNKMVNLLSTITNLQSDTINIQLNKCDLIELVKEEVKYHQVRNKNSSLILKFQNRTSSYYSIVDNFWFKQVLGILITNAMNHTEKGVIKIRVGITKEESTESFCLRVVSDEGTGIPKDELESIFLPLQRGSHSIEKFPGSGIGLTIAKEVVKAHGGNIIAQNNTKAGAIFVTSPSFTNFSRFVLFSIIKKIEFLRSRIVSFAFTVRFTSFVLYLKILVRLSGGRF